MGRHNKMDKKKYLIAVRVEGKAKVFEFESKIERGLYLITILNMDDEVQYALSETVEA
tara:strand:+ start:133 stop:306 length:174 start_codon:yes stop_codon:yes gene_type:complete